MTTCSRLPQTWGPVPRLARLGNSQQLATGYLSAHFGDEPRPSWWAAAIFFLTAQLFFTEWLREAAVAFGDGLTAADPHLTGTFTWGGLDFVQSSVTYTYADGQGTFVGGAWTPLAWALWIVATVLVGRLWRAPLAWRRRRAAGAGEAQAQS